MRVLFSFWSYPGMGNVIISMGALPPTESEIKKLETELRSENNLPSVIITGWFLLRDEDAKQPETQPQPVAANQSEAA